MWTLNDNALDLEFMEVLSNKHHFTHFVLYSHWIYRGMCLALTLVISCPVRVTIYLCLRALSVVEFRKLFCIRYGERLT